MFLNTLPEELRDTVSLSVDKFVDCVKQLTHSLPRLKLCVGQALFSWV